VAMLAAAMAGHSMAADPDESYYRDRYWDWIKQAVGGVAVDRPFLDAGCGQGRLLAPLSRLLEARGGSAIGVDLLPGCVAEARAVLAAEHAKAEVVCADLATFLLDQEDGSFSGALFLEVGFVLTDLPGVLRELARVLVPGAPLLASLRSRTFLAHLAVTARDWPLADAVVAEPDGGRQLPGMGHQNWSTARGARNLVRAAGFEVVDVRGLGGASGIAADPLSALARPSELSSSAQARLATVEDALGRDVPDLGRYILVHARRSFA
jgi:SAM-dependent methyltransferase